MPWFTVSSTSVSPEDAESSKDYILSGGSFNDVEIPTMFIKRLMDIETLKLFMPALTKAIEVDRAPHCAHTIVDTLRAVVMGRIPRRACLTKVLQWIRTNNAMGSRGENTITFSEGLMFDLKQSGWQEMSMAKAGCLIWLTDLTLTNVHHI